jgi:hypothetical protein
VCVCATVLCKCSRALFSLRRLCGDATFNIPGENSIPLFAKNACPSILESTSRVVVSAMVAMAVVAVVAEGGGGSGFQ